MIGLDHVFVFVKNISALTSFAVPGVHCSQLRWLWCFMCTCSNLYHEKMCCLEFDNLFILFLIVDPGSRLLLRFCHFISLHLCCWAVCSGVPDVPSEALWIQVQVSSWRRTLQLFNICIKRVSIFYHILSFNWRLGEGSWSHSVNSLYCAYLLFYLKNKYWCQGCKISNAVIWPSLDFLSMLQKYIKYFKSLFLSVYIVFKLNQVFVVWHQQKRVIVLIVDTI